MRSIPSHYRLNAGDGTEREVTFFYSDCGCPVKVMARRNGDKPIRTKELPVIFPDDPAVERPLPV